MPERRLLLVAVLVLAGCRGMTSTKPPIHPNPNMDQQPKARPQSESDFFYDGANMRAPVPGTVARGELREDRAYFEGKDAAGADVAHSPVESTPERLARGADRYGIYCQPCHDERGEGKGVLSERAKVPTANLMDKRVVDLPDGAIFDTITNGKGLMASYRYPVVAHDRWAIIAYVRQLQQERQAQVAAK